MFGKKKEKKPAFTKATTPEGIRKQRAAIVSYYANKNANKSTTKLKKK